MLARAQGEGGRFRALRCFGSGTGDGKIPALNTELVVWCS